ncbi:MAG: phosphatidylcholine/phosphatidylserine synthase [Alphaproteobacteria bacterium]|nr:phosphatidylcholine/phosphatidylserine synthase [Alphaproteobacteria bacterium]
MLKRKSRRKSRRGVPRFKGLSISKLIPNMITVGATCAGLTGVRFAIDEKWEFAVVAIIVAGVLDALDGRMARLLNSASDFGAELDSLSDFVSFGVSPALILYFWSLSSLGGIGWAVCLFLAICCGLRLARFNTNIGRLPPYAYNYFTGVPAPAGAGLALLPLMATFAFGLDILREPVFVAVWTVIAALLMVSRLPTFSFKKIKIPTAAILPVLVVAGLLVAGLAGAPWRTLTLVVLVYIVSFGYSAWTFRRLKAEAERMHDERDSDDPAEVSPDEALDKPRLRPVE